MKTYEVTHRVEMLVRQKVRARNADEANDIAFARTSAQIDRLERQRANIAFDSEVQDWVEARDD